VAQLDDLIEQIEKRGGLMDEITLKILDNGDIKVETGKFNPMIHTEAQSLLDETKNYLGGETRMTKKMARRHHSHTHVHQGQTK